MRVQGLDPHPRPLDHLARMGSADALAIDGRVGTVRFAELDDLVGRLAAVYTRFMRQSGG